MSRLAIKILWVIAAWAAALLLGFRMPDAVGPLLGFWIIVFANMTLDDVANALGRKV